MLLLVQQDMSLNGGAVIQRDMNLTAGGNY